MRAILYWLFVGTWLISFTIGKTIPQHIRISATLLCGGIYIWNTYVTREHIVIFSLLKFWRTSSPAHGFCVSHEDISRRFKPGIHCMKAVIIASNHEARLACTCCLRLLHVSVLDCSSRDGEGARACLRFLKPRPEAIPQC